MGEASQILDFIDAAIGGAARAGLAMRTAEDERLDGREITLDGRRVVSFTSCSYLGLELDPRVRQGAIDAVERYGTQFSSSRSYLSAPAYEELEALLGQAFGGHALVTPNTTLAHLSALPVLIAEEDAVILDHHVHQTVHLAVPQLRAQGCHVEFLRHGRLDLLEERLVELASGHRRVWYLADGIYSMFGSGAPIQALRYLATEHEALHLYIDDAHGTSWTGRHGRGFALEHLAGFERAVVSVSLNKSFGAAGGALVFPDAEQRRRVLTCGGPMIFTGPVQPPMLGAAIASARIHLSPEIETLQAELMQRIRHFNARARELDLPLATRSEVPIRYLGLGHPRTAHEMVKGLLERGFFVNGAIFPAVPVKKSGVRATLTRHQRIEDLDALLEGMAELLPDVLAATEMTREVVDRNFHLHATPAPAAATRSAEGLTLSHETSIDAIDPELWDARLGGRGCFDHAALRVLEQVFGAGQAPEDRWRFHYFLVRDARGEVVLATFFTEALWKDDLVAEARVSERVELERRRDPYFLTSRVIGMGSLLTEGDHLYLDRSADWRAALRLLLAAVDATADACDASRVVLRDLSADDAELDAALRDQGFSVVACPDTMQLDVDWSSWEAHLEGMGGKSRRFQRQQVAPHDKDFELEILGGEGRQPEPREWQQLYQLYRNLHAKSLDLNVYPLPLEFFRKALATPGWELLALRLSDPAGGSPIGPFRAFVLAWRGAEVYVPLVGGLDYEFVRSHGGYRQLLRRVCLRARELHAARVLFGMGAELEKRRFGARHVERRLYFQSRDHFQTDALSLISREVATEAAEVKRS